MFLEEDNHLTPGSEIGEPPDDRGDKVFCPLDGGEAIGGYGLMGGGIGCYMFCANEGCTWFWKQFDREE